MEIVDRPPSRSKEPTGNESTACLQDLRVWSLLRGTAGTDLLTLTVGILLSAGCAVCRTGASLPERTSGYCQKRNFVWWTVSSPLRFAISVLNSFTSALAKPTQDIGEGL